MNKMKNRATLTDAERKQIYKEAKEEDDERFNNNLDNVKRLIKLIEEAGYRVNKDNVRLTTYSTTLTINNK